MIIQVYWRYPNSQFLIVYRCVESANYSNGLIELSFEFKTVRRTWNWCRSIKPKCCPHLILQFAKYLEGLPCQLCKVIGAPYDFNRIATTPSRIGLIRCRATPDILCSRGMCIYSLVFVRGSHLQWILCLSIIPYLLLTTICTEELTLQNLHIGNNYKTSIQVVYTKYFSVDARRRKGIPGFDRMMHIARNPPGTFEI